MDPRLTPSGLAERAVLDQRSDRRSESLLSPLGPSQRSRLAEAIGLYRSAGYLEVAPFNDEPYAHHWFEEQLG